MKGSAAQAPREARGTLIGPESSAAKVGPIRSAPQKKSSTKKRGLRLHLGFSLPRDISVVN